MAHRGFLPLFWGLGAGCVPAVDDDLSLVESSRVLAVLAEPPEAAEGESVSLTALVAPSEAAGDEVSYAACLERKPLSELGPVSPSCLRGGSSESLRSFGSGPSVQATIDRGACSSFGPRRPTAEAGQPAGRPVDPDPTGGFYQPIVASLPGQLGVLGAVRLDCGLPGADRDLVVEYNGRHRINQNPAIDRLERRDDEGWVEVSRRGEESEDVVVALSTQLSLRVSWASCGPDEACTGAETYVLFDSGAGVLVEQTEALFASWYATAGVFHDYRTGASPGAGAAENLWLAPGEPGPVDLWVVLRDGRGGVSFGSYRVVVR